MHKRASVTRLHGVDRERQKRTQTAPTSSNSMSTSAAASSSTRPTTATTNSNAISSMSHPSSSSAPQGNHPSTSELQYSTMRRATHPYYPPEAVPPQLRLQTYEEHPQAHAYYPPAPMAGMVPTAVYGPAPTTRPRSSNGVYASHSSLVHMSPHPSPTSPSLLTPVLQSTEGIRQYIAHLEQTSAASNADFKAQLESLATNQKEMRDLVQTVIKRMDDANATTQAQNQLLIALANKLSEVEKTVGKREEGGLGGGDNRSLMTRLAAIEYAALDAWETIKDPDAGQQRSGRIQRNAVAGPSTSRHPLNNQDTPIDVDNLSTPEPTELRQPEVPTITLGPPSPPQIFTQVPTEYSGATTPVELEYPPDDYIPPETQGSTTAPPPQQEPHQRSKTPEPNPTRGAITLSQTEPSQTSSSEAQTQPASVPLSCTPRRSSCTLGKSLESNNFSPVDWSKSPSKASTATDTAVFRPNAQILAQSAFELPRPPEGSVAELRLGVTGRGAYIGEDAGTSSGLGSTMAGNRVTKLAVSPLPSPETSPSRETTPIVFSKGKGKAGLVEEDEDELMEDAQDVAGAAAEDEDMVVDEVVTETQGLSEAPAELAPTHTPEAEMDDEPLPSSHLPTPPVSGNVSSSSDGLHAAARVDEEKGPTTPQSEHDRSGDLQLDPLMQSFEDDLEKYLRGLMELKELDERRMTIEREVEEERSRAREKEMQEAERAREAQRQAELEQEREAARLREEEAERAREAERQRQMEQERLEKEAERQREQAEAPRLLEEAERQRAFEKAREEARLQERERARERELRAQEAAREEAAAREREAEMRRVKEAERARALERAKAAEREKEAQRVREAEAMAADEARKAAAAAAAEEQARLALVAEAERQAQEASQAVVEDVAMNEDEGQPQDYDFSLPEPEAEPAPPSSSWAEAQEQIASLLEPSEPETEPLPTFDDASADFVGDWTEEMGDHDEGAKQAGIMTSTPKTKASPGLRPGFSPSPAPVPVEQDDEQMDQLFDDADDMYADEPVRDNACETAGVAPADTMGAETSGDEPEESLFLPSSDVDEDLDDQPLQRSQPVSSRSSVSRQAEPTPAPSQGSQRPKPRPIPRKPRASESSSTQPVASSQPSLSSGPGLLSAALSNLPGSPSKQHSAPPRTPSRLSRTSSSSNISLGLAAKLSQRPNDHAASRTLVRTPSSKSLFTSPRKALGAASSKKSSSLAPSSSRMGGMSASTSTSSAAKEKDVIEISSDEDEDIGKMPKKEKESPRKTAQDHIKRRKERDAKRSAERQQQQVKVKKEGGKEPVKRKESVLLGTIDLTGASDDDDDDVAEKKEWGARGKERELVKPAPFEKGKAVVKEEKVAQVEKPKTAGLTKEGTSKPMPRKEKDKEVEEPAMNTEDEPEVDSDSDSDVDVVPIRAKRKLVPGTTPAASQVPKKSRILDRVKVRQAQAPVIDRVVRKRKESEAAPEDDRPLKRAKEVRTGAAAFVPSLPMMRPTPSQAPTPTPAPEASGSKVDGSNPRQGTASELRGDQGHAVKKEVVAEAMGLNSSFGSTASRASEVGDSDQRSLRGRTVDLKGDPIDWPPMNRHGTKKHQQEMILCDKCETWYHYGCVDIKVQDPRLEDGQEFQCPPCQAGVVQKHLSDKERHEGKCGRQTCLHGPPKKCEFFLEKIVGRKVNPKRSSEWVWLVKWAGYTLKDSTWEGKKHLTNPDKAIAEFVDAAEREGRRRELVDRTRTVLLKEVEDSEWTDDDD